VPRAELERAKRLYGEGDYLGAAAAFEAVLAAKPKAKLHFNIANAYRLASEPKKALEHFSLYLKVFRARRGLVPRCTSADAHDLRFTASRR
jgi:hypothetical protein